MRSVLRIALGIIAALGGFLDIGDIVFTTQAGALYRYDLLWAVALGTIGIAVYAEMCGRVAAVTGRPVFDAIRMRMGFGLGLIALVASTFVNVLTVAAELGGLAIVLQLLFDAEFSLFVVLLAGPVDTGKCLLHLFPPRIELTCADREVPLRVLIVGRSGAPLPVAASGASDRREALVSSGPSRGQASLALSRRRSASLCVPPGSSTASLRSASISRSQKNKGEVLL